MRPIAASPASRAAATAPWSRRCSGPDLFGGLATHAGDALFEACYQPEFPEAARALRDHYGGSFDAFWTDFRSRPGRSRPGDPALVNEWAMAACYSTDADGTVRLPFDVATGRLIPEVWERWLAWDPVRMAAGHADALRGLKRDLGRRRQERRVLPRPRRAGVRRRARRTRHRRAGAAVRAVRRHARRDRVALPAGDRLAGGAARVDARGPRRWHATRYRRLPWPLGGRAGKTHAELLPNDLQT